MTKGNGRRKMLTIENVFCKDGKPYDSVEWERRNVELKGSEKKDSAFFQEGVEVPTCWSERSAFIAAAKYFRGHIGKSNREISLKQLFDRVVDTITEAGQKFGYFNKRNAKKFAAELKWLLVNQRMAFNSPVFFNVGITNPPQGSACFILSIEDTLKSIAKLQPTEVKIFSDGSGAGTNLSPLRAAWEPLSRGGWASGPLSFNRGYDAWAGIILSGGTNRRASKMVRLDDSHPDVYNGQNNGTDFISFKAHEEKKAWALIKMGYDASFGGEAYASVSGQNENFSVGLSDDFIKACIDDKEWKTKEVVSKKTALVFRAREMMEAIASAAHLCGDPGVQFDDHINDANTCMRSGRIRSSNPCGEFLFLDDSACNLASLNLVKFASPQEGIFFEEEFRQAAHLTIIAQDILIDMSSYPTDEITENSKAYRPLGLGFTNLGGLLMALGLPYDSDSGRLWAASITALLTGQAYKTSSELASVLGPFEHFSYNKKPMMKVIRRHRAKLQSVTATHGTEADRLISVASDIWDDVVTAGNKTGFRNAQVTLVAPTGTISHLMDSATTGIEPDLNLVWRKKLVGGEEMVIMNSLLGVALDTLGYEKTADGIIAHIEKTGSAEGCHIKDSDLGVFDTAYPAAGRTRVISSMGHLKMLAAVQPFISGGISKTVGLPKSTAIEEIRDLYITAWKMGLKSLTVFRTGSKMVQPVTAAHAADGTPIAAPTRRRLPQDRDSKTRDFQVAGLKGYLTASFYPEDGKVGEMFCWLAKEGSTLAGMMACFSKAISVGLQYGVPLETYIKNFTSTRFDPMGFTGDDIRQCSSIVDYIFKYLSRFSKDPKFQLPSESSEGQTLPSIRRRDTSEIVLDSLQIKDEENILEIGTADFHPDSKVCVECGNLMMRVSGTCYWCNYCEESNGACGG